MDRRSAVGAAGEARGRDPGSLDPFRAEDTKPPTGHQLPHGERLPAVGNGDAPVLTPTTWPCATTKARPSASRSRSAGPRTTAVEKSRTSRAGVVPRRGPDQVDSILRARAARGRGAISAAGRKWLKDETKRRRAARRSPAARGPRFRRDRAAGVAPTQLRRHGRRRRDRAAYPRPRAEPAGDRGLRPEGAGELPPPRPVDGAGRIAALTLRSSRHGSASPPADRSTSRWATRSTIIWCCPGSLVAASRRRRAA